MGGQQLPLHGGHTLGGGSRDLPRVDTRHGERFRKTAGAPPRALDLEPLPSQLHQRGPGRLTLALDHHLIGADGIGLQRLAPYGEAVTGMPVDAGAYEEAAAARPDAGQRLVGVALAVADHRLGNLRGQGGERILRTLRPLVGLLLLQWAAVAVGDAGTVAGTAPDKPRL